MSLRVIFAGTPQFAVPSLETLLTAEADVVLVLTQPDRPAGRGRKLQQSPVKQVAIANNLTVHQPESLKSETNFLRRFLPDIMIVAAYGLLLPGPVLALPPFGCVNVHASLLPRWRGAAPIARAIQAGDTQTGITLMQMDKGLDTGTILLQQKCAIEDNDTSQSLHDKLAELGGQMLAAALPKIENRELQAYAQNDQEATYAEKIAKSEALLDWTMPAQVLARKIRAMNPWPVCYTFHNNNLTKIWYAIAVEGSTSESPGTVLDTSAKGIAIQTGQGVLQAGVLQRPGGKPLPCAEFVNGYAILAGDRLQND